MARTYDWNGKTCEMIRPDISDEEAAGRVRMLMRSDLDHEFVCSLGRDRIMALAKEKAEFEQQHAALVEAARAKLGDLMKLAQADYPDPHMVLRGPVYDLAKAGFDELAAGRKEPSALSAEE